MKHTVSGVVLVVCVCAVQLGGLLLFRVFRGAAATPTTAAVLALQLWLLRRPRLLFCGRGFFLPSLCFFLSPHLFFRPLLFSRLSLCCREGPCLRGTSLGQLEEEP